MIVEKGHCHSTVSFLLRKSALIGYNSKYCNGLEPGKQV